MSSAMAEVAEQQDGRRARGDKTRRAILVKAVDLASVDGLDGLSIGGLATALGVSKSGLFAHFGSKLELQLATIDAAADIFEEAVWNTVADLEPGLPRLVGVARSWLAYFRHDVFSGGCFFANAEHEFDSRPGPVHDRIAEQKQRWTDTLIMLVKAAQRRGQIRPEVDPEQIAFELDAAGMMGNLRWQLNDDPKAFEHAAAAIRRSLESAVTADGRRLLDATVGANEL
jgi:AcrR family transcriptional regulator